VAKLNRLVLVRSQFERIARIRDGQAAAATRHATVRDTIAELPNPVKNPGSTLPIMSSIRARPGYKEHTGSPLDEPAETLKAGDQGVRRAGKTCCCGPMARCGISSFGSGSATDVL
jgi:DNA (cytosine-5)-methyltransferase 1